jgi:dephospho-CoA kinase
MAIIFITGLSGCGKSTTIMSLKAKGYHAYDLDEGYTDKNIDNETVIDEKKFYDLILKHIDNDLFVSACYSNQGKFYEYFDDVVLLHAPLSVMEERIRNRVSNNYGKQEEEWIEIKRSYDEVLPLLRNGATMILNTSELSVDDIETLCLSLIKRTIK